MILYINSCAREKSRTNRLAKALLNKLGEYEELKLNEMEIRPLDGERLKHRTAQLDEGNYEDSMFDLSKQFAAADIIVIAAPYWDGSFPAVLKTYVENIYVTGIVSRFDDKGCPQGLCKAKKLYYVATAGGKYDPSFSYDYFNELARKMFGIGETELVYAELLDIVGNDSEAILAETIEKIHI